MSVARRAVDALVDDVTTTPDSPVGWVGYVLEIALSLGLLARALAHVIGYLADLGEEQREGAHPLEVEYGLSAAFAVREDARGREPTPGAIATVSLATSACALFVGAYLWMAGAYSYPPAVMLYLGANYLVVVGDPVLLAAHAVFSTRK